MPTLNLDYTSSVGFSFDSSKLEFNGGLKLAEVSPGVYDTNPQSAEHKAPILVNALTSFSVVDSVAGADLILHNIILNGVRKYFDPDAETWGDAGPAEFNTEAEINDNVETLFPDTINAEVDVISYLVSDDGTTTPTLTSVSIGYATALDLDDYPVEADVRGGLVYQNGAKIGSMVLQTAFEASEDEDLNALFGDLAVPVTWSSPDVETMGLLDSPDLTDGSLVMSTEYKLTMVASVAASLPRGKILIVDGEQYTIREAPRKIEDGKLVTMELSKT